MNETCSGVDGLKFLPQLWSNVDEKMNKSQVYTCSTPCFIALNDCLWIICHSLGEKMIKKITFCENCFGTRYSYPNRFGVCWGSPTPLETWDYFKGNKFTWGILWALSPIYFGSRGGLHQVRTSCVESCLSLKAFFATSYSFFIHFQSLKTMKMKIMMTT